MTIFLLCISYPVGWMALSIGKLHPDTFSFRQIIFACQTVHWQKLLMSFILPLSMIICFRTGSLSIFMDILLLLTFYLLLRLTITDMMYFLVPLYPLILWILIGGYLQGIFHTFHWLDGCLRFLLVYSLGCLLYYLMRGTFGLGDVYFLSALAFLSHLSLVFSVLKLAIILAGGFALIGIFTKRIKRKDMLPFIPFLCLSLWFHILWKPWLFLVL